jgi:hypothetical protein
MKKTGLFIFVILCFVFPAKANDHDAESILLARGYTKFYHKELFIPDVYRETYTEIFHSNFHFERTGVKNLRLSLPNDFVYRLYYDLAKEELPNILSVVFIDTDEGRVGFYKKNLLLTGVKVQAVLEDLTGTMFKPDQLVFY